MQPKALCADRFGLRQPFFLYVARLEHPAKNHVPLIAAFNRFKTGTRSNWQLALAGADWHGAGQIHKAISASAFANDIRCLGFVPDDFVPDLYRAADLFVYPSLFEGFGMPPLEAMACGCPVLSSPRGSLKEVLGNAAVLVDPEDVDALATQLGYLSSNPGLRHEMKAAGLAQAQRFDWSRTASAMAGLYERAAKGAGPNPQGDFRALALPSKTSR
jgi:glycosyltransferase involved in cell wall biosynthesis